MSEYDMHMCDCAFCDYCGDEVSPETGKLERKVIKAAEALEDEPGIEAILRLRQSVRDMRTTGGTG